MGPSPFLHFAIHYRKTAFAKSVISHAILSLWPCNFHIGGLPLITYAPRGGRVGVGGSSLLYISIVYYMQKKKGGGGEGVQIACKNANNGRPIWGKITDLISEVRFDNNNSLVALN